MKQYSKNEEKTERQNNRLYRTMQIGYKQANKVLLILVVSSIFVSIKVQAQNADVEKAGRIMQEQHDRQSGGSRDGSSDASRSGGSSSTPITTPKPAAAPDYNRSQFKIDKQKTQNDFKTTNSSTTSAKSSFKTIKTSIPTNEAYKSFHSEANINSTSSEKSNQITNTQSNNSKITGSLTEKFNFANTKQKTQIVPYTKKTQTVFSSTPVYMPSYTPPSELDKAKDKVETVVEMAEDDFWYGVLTLIKQGPVFFKGIAGGIEGYLETKKAKERGALISSLYKRHLNVASNNIKSYFAYGSFDVNSMNKEGKRTEDILKKETKKEVATGINSAMVSGGK